MRSGFFGNGVGRFIVSSIVIAGVGLGIGAFGPGMLAGLSKPAQAQDVLTSTAPTSGNLYAPAAQAASKNIVVAGDPTVYPHVASVRIVAGLDEPLVAGGPTTAEEDAALTAATDAILANKVMPKDYPEAAAPLIAFVNKYPDSNWNTAVLTNLGLGYVRAGYYSRAIDAFERAWVLGKDSNLLEARNLADRTFGELVRMHARIGHADRLEALFNGLGSRTIGAAGATLTQGAREGIAVMRNRPEIAYLCGPKALGNVLTMGKFTPAQLATVEAAKSGPQGFSLTQLSALATQAGISHKLIKRRPGQPVPVPSVVHWGVNHYAAITEEVDGRFQIIDGTFADSTAFVTREALDAEASGYFLVPDGAKASAAPAGENVQGQVAKAATDDWAPVTAGSTEANSVHGMGYESGTQSGNTEIGDATCMTCPTVPTNGMTVADAHRSAASISLMDVPLGYAAPKGPSPAILLSYAQYDAPPSSYYPAFNVSYGWTMSAISFLTDTIVATGGVVIVRMPGGGTRRSTEYVPSLGRYNPDLKDGRSTVKVSDTPVVYERTQRDGTVERYASPDAATPGYPRTVYLTQRIDPQGNALTYSYGTITGTIGSVTCSPSCIRLNSVTDAAGGVTTFTYGHATNPLLVTKITDPFGRFTTLAYNANDRLQSITDPVGIVSSITYGTAQGGAIDAATALTTPYGTTSFSTTGTGGNLRVLQITDPLGGVSRLESASAYAMPIPATEAAAPTGMNVQNNYLNYGNSFFFDAMVLPIAQPTPGGTIDYTKAEITHWFTVRGNNLMSSLVGSIKHPLENRIWFNYNEQYAPYNAQGDLDFPTLVGRVLDDGTTQLSQASYNVEVITPTHTWKGNGALLTKTDPLGRTVKLNYASNFIDVTSVQRQISATPTYATLASFTYDGNHNVTSYTDAAGQVWRYAYNTAGQMIYATNPLNQTRFWEYDSSGRITRITTPVAVAFASVVYGTTNTTAPTVQSFNYSSPCSGVTAPANTNLPISVTDSEGYTLCYQYDPLDRVTVVKYPDGTTDLYDYRFPSTANGWPSNWPVLKPDGVTSYAGTPSLDVWKYTDRRGRVTTYYYDKNRRLISKTEPGKFYATADGATTTTRTTSYEYYANGVLKNLTDANGAVTHWEVDIQSRPTSKTYAYGTANARTESYAYDLAGRLKTVTDAAGQVKTIAYNKDNSVASYTYTNPVDVNFPTPNVTFTYDSYFPRLATMTDSSGFNSATGNPAAATTTMTYTAIGTNGALHLATETNNGYYNQATAYYYDAAGRISSRWAAESSEGYGYDTLGRLNSYSTDLGTFSIGYLGQTGQPTSRSVTNGTTTLTTNWTYDTNANDRRLLTINHNNSAVRSYTYSYGYTVGSTNYTDVYNIRKIKEASNGSHPLGAQVWTYDYDDGDRLISANGVVNTDYTQVGVSDVGTYAWQYDKLDNPLKLTYPPVGTTAGYSDTPSYNNLNQQTLNAWWQNFEYDVNGNTTREYTSTATNRAYKYDFEGRLLQMSDPRIAGGYTVRYFYDGFGRRIIQKLTNNGVTTYKRYLWCGMTLCMQRDMGTGRIRRYFATGEYDYTASKKYVYMQDHLGSVRDLVDASNATRVGALDYKPYGAVKATQPGGVLPDFQYAGLLWVGEVGLNASTTRFYDGGPTRWLSRDALAPWRYGYVDANSMMNVDPSGLISINFDFYIPGFGVGGGISVGIDDKTGAPFASVRGGFGVGGGFTIDWYGERPGKPDCSSTSLSPSGGIVIAPFAKAGGTIGAGDFGGVDFGGSTSVAVEVGARPNTRPSLPSSPEPPLLGNISTYPKPPQWENLQTNPKTGAELGAAVGVEVTIFGKSNCSCANQSNSN